MSGFFEHLAANDDSRRVAGRKALALARARADRQYGDFVHSAKTVYEKEQRLALVAGDLATTVRQACADCNYDAYENVLETVQEHLGMVVEAVRKPKMCPYHNEVTDISLAQGEPQAGFSAMAQHAWGANHCQGEWDGRCNFKAEMTTQSYWDQKAEKAQQRRQERELALQQEMTQMPEPVAEENFDVETDVSSTPDVGTDETSAVGFGAEPAVAEPQMAMAAGYRKAATVPQGNLHGGVVNALRMIGSKKPGGTINGIDLAQIGQEHYGQGPFEVQHPHPKFENIIAQIVQSGSPQPLYDALGQGQKAAGFREAEALKTVDLTEGSDTAFPKMDKRKWTPENVKLRVDTEMEGSPHPTVEIDIAEPANYSGEDFLKGTKAVSETQDVTKGSDFSSDKAHGSWPSSGGKSAVSAVPQPGVGCPHGQDPNTCPECLRANLAGPGNQNSALAERIQQGPPANAPYMAAQDPDRNPIAELISEEEAQRAINEFNGEN